MIQKIEELNIMGSLFNLLKELLQEKWDLPASRQLLYRDAVAAAVGSEALADAGKLEPDDRIIAILAPEPVIRLGAELGEPRTVASVRPATL